MGPGSGEALEAALGIAESGATQADQQLKDPTHELAQWRLPEPAGPGRRPGADGNAGPRELGRKEASQLLYGHGKVGVALEPVLARRSLHPDPDGVTLAPVRLRDEANAPNAACDVGDEVRRRVRAAVIDDDDFPAVGLAGEMRGNLGKGVDDSGLFVEGRDDDGEERRSLRAGYSSAPST